MGGGWYLVWDGGLRVGSWEVLANLCEHSLALFAHKLEIRRKVAARVCNRGYTLLPSDLGGGGHEVQ